MPDLKEMTEYLETLAPAELTEPWDNTGLLVACSGAVTGVLCCLDVKPETVEEACREGCNLIVSHHPVIFHPLKRLSEQDVPALLMRAGISAVCLHTNLDKAQGGVNDHLAQLLGLENVQPFAGGIGRLGTLPHAMTAREFAEYTGRIIHTPVKLANPAKIVERTALVTGSGGDFVREAAQAGADCLLTGEAGHHDALDAAALGIALIAATHYATETGIADVLRQTIQERFPELRVCRSKADADPFCYII